MKNQDNAYGIWTHTYVIRQNGHMKIQDKKDVGYDVS